MNISHKELIEILKSLGYHVDDKGLCVAHSFLVDISIALKKQPDYLDRLSLMSHLLGDTLSSADRLKKIKAGFFKDIIDAAHQQIKITVEALKNEGLTAEERTALDLELQANKKIIEIKAYCELLSLIFFPEEYTRSQDLLTFPIAFQDRQKDRSRESLLSLVSPAPLEEKGGLKDAFKFHLSLDKKTKTAGMNAFFWVLSKIIEEVHARDPERMNRAGIAIAIGGPQHQVSACFHETNGNLLLFDSNRLPYREYVPYKIGNKLVGDGLPVFNVKNTLFPTAPINFDFAIRTTGDTAALVNEVCTQHREDLDRCNRGWLPAHFAAEIGDQGMLIQLKENPANFTLENDDGNTAIAIAINKNHWSILAYFLLNMPSSQIISTKDMEVLMHNRHQLIEQFDRILIDNPKKRAMIIHAILNKENALGVLLMSVQDEIAKRIENYLPTNRSSLIYKTPMTTSKRLTLLNTSFAENRGVEMIIDRLYEKPSITLSLINSSLFAKPPLPEKAMELSNHIHQFCQQSPDDARVLAIKASMQRWLGENALVQEYFATYGLAKAIEMKAVITLAGCYTNLIEHTNHASIAQISDLYSDPEQLSSILTILMALKNEAKAEVAYAYKALQILYTYNPSIQNSFEQVWKDSPISIDRLDEGLSLSYICKLTPHIAPNVTTPANNTYTAGPSKLR